MKGPGKNKASEQTLKKKRGGREEYGKKQKKSIDYRTKQKINRLQNQTKNGILLYIRQRKNTTKKSLSMKTYQKQKTITHFDFEMADKKKTYSTNWIELKKHFSIHPLDTLLLVYFYKEVGSL